MEEQVSARKSAGALKKETEEVGERGLSKGKTVNISPVDDEE